MSASEPEYPFSAVAVTWNEPDSGPAVNRPLGDTVPPVAVNVSGTVIGCWN